MKLKIALAFLLAAVVWGCENKPAEGTGSTTGATTKTTTGSTGTTGDPAPEQAVSLDQIPASLKNDAFEYYGLGYDKPVDLEWSSGSGQVQSGTQTFKLKEVHPDEAVFEVERTGGLANLGSETLSLKSDGVYIKDSSAKISGDRLELPNSLTPGHTWTTKQGVEIQGRKIVVTQTYKVVGMKKLTTKAGTYDALLIRANGSGKIDNQSVTMAYELWLVKGRGALKTSVTMTQPGGKKDVITIQETK